MLIAKDRKVQMMKDVRVIVCKTWQFLLAIAMVAGTVSAVTAHAADSDAIAGGKRIAFNTSKGNCLACHHMDGGESPGDLGPPLVAIAARFPDKYVLRRHLWDPMESNPASKMPPFGRHRILTEEEIDMIVEYIYTL